MSLATAITGVLKSPFQQDADLVQKYTGATLTQDQFDGYKDRFTLRGTLGNDSEIRREYYHIGIPTEASNTDVMNDILDKLNDAGIVYDLDDPANEAVFQKLKASADNMLVTGNWPRVRPPYTESPRLIQAVRQSREQLKLPPVEHVMG